VLRFLLDFRLALTQAFNLQFEIFFPLEEDFQLQGFLISGLIVDGDRVSSRRTIAGARNRALLRVPVQA
jgi:hypothetical protein